MQALPCLSRVHSRRPSSGVLSRLHDSAEDSSSRRSPSHSTTNSPSFSAKKSRRARTSKAPERRSSLTDQCLIRSFRCPISGRLMADPVVIADGHSFERDAISDWFERGHMKSPMTGAPLPNAEVVPNHALRSAISEYIENLESNTANQAAGVSENDAYKCQPQQVNYSTAEVESLKRECEFLTEQCEASELQRRALEADLSFLERRFTERARESMSQQRHGSEKQSQRNALHESSSNISSKKITGHGGMMSQVKSKLSACYTHLRCDPKSIVLLLSCIFSERCMLVIRSTSSWSMCLLGCVVLRQSAQISKGNCIDLKRVQVTAQSLAMSLTVRTSVAVIVSMPMVMK